MTKRIVEVSTEGCYLRCRHAQLVIEKEKEVLGKVPIEDMSALIIDHPQTLITQACLARLLEDDVMVVSSDSKHQPVGMFMPLQSNTLQTERFKSQLSASTPLKKRIWKQLIQGKIRLQAKILKDLTGKDAGLSVLAKKVRSGDPDNIEAQAARRYWRRLFSESSFKRDRFADDQNRYLNYTYAIIRALLARSLCGAGLHPSIGIHHHNRYNAYCLADDLMEPYRPFVDLHVWEIVNEKGSDCEMDKTLRANLLGIVKRQVKMETEMLTFQGAMQKTAQSLVKAFNDKSQVLALPDV